MSESYDELSITMDVPLVASALERDGMLKRMEDAVGWAICDIATGYIMSSEANSEKLRVDVEAHGLTDPDLLVAVADQLAALLQAPDAEGWGPYAIAAEDADDDPSVRELTEQLQHDSTFVLGPISAGQLTSKPADAELVAGALFQASVLLLDQLFEDLQSLYELDDDDIPASAASDEADFLLLSQLPVGYRIHYGIRFTQQLIVSAVSLTQRFTTAWSAPACVAEELLLRLVLDLAATQLELAEADIDPTWRSTAQNALFEDSDHDWLFDPDDASYLSSIGSSSMALIDWFTPFSPGRMVAPYLLDGTEPPAADDE